MYCAKSLVCLDGGKAVSVREANDRADLQLVANVLLSLLYIAARNAHGGAAKLYSVVAHRADLIPRRRLQKKCVIAFRENFFDIHNYYLIYEFYHIINYFALIMPIFVY